MLFTQLALGTLILVVVALFHIASLVALAHILTRVGTSSSVKRNSIGSFYLLSIPVLGIIAIHTVEAWAWAGVYLWLGEFAELSNALYFSVVTATTLGYGDIVLSERWQLLGTFEAMGGLILFGASTAFLIRVLRQVFFDE